MRKQDDLPDRRCIGQQHDQPIDTDAFTCGGRQSVLQGTDVVFVHGMRFIVAGFLLQQLLGKAIF